MGKNELWKDKTIILFLLFIISLVTFFQNAKLSEGIAEDMVYQDISIFETDAAISFSDDNEVNEIPQTERVAIPITPEDNLVYNAFLGQDVTLEGLVSTYSEKELLNQLVQRVQEVTGSKTNTEEINTNREERRQIIQEELSIVEQEFKNKEHVDIIIWLRDNKFTSPEYQDDLDKKREEIRNMQDSILSTLSEEEFQLKYRYVVTNGFAGIVSKEGFEKLKTNPLVESIFLDHEVHALLTESRPLIQAEIVEKLGYTGKGQTVCVLDSGINYKHLNLGGCFGTKCKVVGGYDFCNGVSPLPPRSLLPCTGPNDSDPMDEQGHGTYVAGIVASNHNTYRGIAPDAKLVAIKVLNATGWGTLGALAKGIDWCTNNQNVHNIQIITMSLGYTGPSTNCPTHIDRAITNAANVGIFIDAASGNDGSTIGIDYPACAPKVVSVGAVYDANVGTQDWGFCKDQTTKADKVVCFTNRNKNLDLLAPGSIINSTLLKGSFGGGSGTSAAAPHVAGIAALLRQANPSLTPQHIELLMKNNSIPVRDPKTSLTFPRIDALAAIKALPSLTVQDKAPVGEKITIKLSDKEHANKPYILLMALGNKPGISFGNNRKIPLTYDGLFQASLFFPTAIGLQNSQGNLDGNGNAIVSWTIPNIPTLRGLQVYFVFITIDPTASSLPNLISSISPDVFLSLTFGNFSSDKNTIALWHFDEGSGNIVKDTSGNNYHGTIKGAKWTTGYLRKALDFDGVNNYIAIQSGRSILANVITVEAWINVDKIRGNSLFDAIVGHSKYKIGIGDLRFPKRPVFVFTGNWAGCYWGRCPAGGPVSFNKWHHIALQYSENAVRVFLDGKLVGYYKNYGPKLGVSGHSGTIGADYGGQYYKNFFDGKIDEVRISNIERY